MSNHDTACLDRAWPIISHLIHLLIVRVAGLSARTQSMGDLYRLMRLAESLVRRWLALKACQNSECKQRRVSLRALSHGNVDKKPNTQAPKHIRLVEPERPMPVFTYQSETETQPGFYILGPAHGSGKTPTRNIPQAFNPANLRRRCDALAAVLNDPERHVRRMARWLARAAKACARVIPFRVGWPPGSSKRQRRLDPERIGMLIYLDDLARAAIRRMQQFRVASA
ncbi:MAG: hypothetical protein AAFV59_05075 [Pseudomonadota bacterium]